MAPKDIPSGLEYDKLEDMTEAELWRHYMIYTQWLAANSEKTVANASQRDLNYLNYGIRVKAKLRDILRDLDIHINL
jgi:hypothetical protein